MLTPYPKRGLTKKAPKPLRRSTRLRQARTGSPRRGRALDLDHLAFVRSLRCAGCGGLPPNDPHHETSGRGLGQKADDRRALPFCRRCHDEFHDGRGRFEGWSKARRRGWQADVVAAVLALRELAAVGHG